MHEMSHFIARLPHLDAPKLRTKYFVPFASFFEKTETGKGTIMGDVL